MAISNSGLMAGSEPAFVRPTRRRFRPPARAVAARVTDELADEFRAIANRLGVKRNDVIKAAVEAFVRQHREQADLEKHAA